MITYKMRQSYEKPAEWNKFILDQREAGERPDQKVAYVSYPRSGNTFFRALLERAGIPTGSDGDVNRIMTFSLYLSGLDREGFTNEEVEVIHTHFPLRKIPFKKFTANKFLFCVRHPIDICVSMFDLWCT